MMNRELNLSLGKILKLKNSASCLNLTLINLDIEVFDKMYCMW